VFAKALRFFLCLVLPDKKIPKFAAGPLFYL
jgi:hypothetical protein